MYCTVQPDCQVNALTLTMEYSIYVNTPCVLLCARVGSKETCVSRLRAVYLNRNGLSTGCGL